METTDETAGAGEFWEQHYGQRAQIWSGRPNAQLVHFAAPLAPGRALDLGCGEGADAVWLAEQGWRVTAVDISEVALGRARVAAAGAWRRRPDRLQPARSDRHLPAGLVRPGHGPVPAVPLEFPREVVLRSAAAAVAPGGRLLIVEHGEAPPWSGLRHHHVHFPTPQETLDALRVDETWSCEHLGRLERAATSPDGEPALLVDNVLLLRRDA